MQLPPVGKHAVAALETRMLLFLKLSRLKAPRFSISRWVQWRNPCIGRFSNFVSWRAEAAAWLAIIIERVLTEYRFGHNIALVSCSIS